MVNKKKIIIILTVIFILMLIPNKIMLKDGGSIQYKAILYEITKIHRLSEQSSTGYEDGWKVKVLGIQVYNTSTIYVEALPKITLNELKSIQKEIDDSLNRYRENNKYNNFASSGVNEKMNRVIIELVDNSVEEQLWFRNNIYDSKYIKFEQGGPYYTQ